MGRLRYPQSDSQRSGRGDIDVHLSFTQIVYAYIPITDSLCSQSGVICNSDYGTSLGRGSFSFQRGAWNDIALHIRLNNPVDVANGVVE